VGRPVWVRVPPPALWFHRSLARTPPCHGGERGSIPLGTVFTPRWRNWQHALDLKSGGLWVVRVRVPPLARHRSRPSSSMVEPLTSNQMTRVRFSPGVLSHAGEAHTDGRVLGKDEVVGSSPTPGLMLQKLIRMSTAFVTRRQPVRSWPGAFALEATAGHRFDPGLGL
jgi:hypothetical protein